MQISGKYIPQLVEFYISKYIVQVHHILVLKKIRKGEKDEYDITGCRSEERCSIARGNKKDTRKNRKRIPWS
jgi:hypothetical protein